MRNRIHISGGDAVSTLALRSGNRDPRLALAALASLGVNADTYAQLPSFPSQGLGRFRVGVDMTQLPNSDGTPAKVEWLPLSGVAGNDIAAAATRDYELKPTKYARPGPLVLDNAIAINLAMTALQIGGKPVFAGSGAVPCALFSHLCFQSALSSYVASNNAPITFTLQNIHASATQTVRGVWLCDTQELSVG
jgi:hypothetical protein